MELSAEDVRDFHEMRDKARIQDLLYREARAIDTRDWDLWYTCFTDDADIDWTENGAIKGKRDEVGPWFIKVCENFPVPAYQHFIANIEITLDGDRATTRELQLIPISLASPGGGRQIAFSGIWFEDEMVRVGKDWKICKRKERLAFRHNFPEAYETPEGY